jgi:endo-1,4-beta-xylanase
MRSIRIASAVLGAAALLAPASLVAAGTASAAEATIPKATTAQRAGWVDKLTLRQMAPRGFKVGTAVAGGGHHVNQPYPDPFPNDRPYRRIMAREFSSLSPENQMKWEFIHPEQGVYRFGPADDIVRFAKRHGQVVRGHTLFWHSQNPAWLNEGEFTDGQLRRILRDHIRTVVGRYKGEIQQWDVANEIFNSDGSYRTENIWINRLGPEIVADAFRWAHRADPKAKLFFNDFGVESPNPKSDAYYQLIQQFQADGVPVHGFSVQGHLSLRFPFPGNLQANLQRFDDLGVETAVTEIDVRMDLPPSGEPTAAQLAQQADYYRQALGACLNVAGCNSFTVWGFTDKYSWVPVFFPTEGEATIMTEDFDKKPAYYALLFRLAEAKYGATPEIVTTTRRSGNAVALTFDDGPDPANTPALLRVLRKHDVRAVFCLWGDHVNQHPGIVRRIAANGHVLCNHTMHHDNMSTWSQAEIRADLRQTNRAIRQAVPGARIPYFRAPFGAWGQTPTVASQMGMQPLGWALAVGDWEPPGEDELVRRLEEGITPDSVVLLHDGGGDRSQTVGAVDRIIPAFEADGWRFALPARQG